MWAPILPQGMDKKDGRVGYQSLFTGVSFQMLHSAFCAAAAGTMSVAIPALYVHHIYKSTMVLL